MKHCDLCAHALWDRTKSNALHPSGDGVCTYQVKSVVVPACWPTSQIPFIPEVQRFRINRKQKLPEHCPTYARKDKA